MECPICDKEVITSRVLTEGEHKHSTNMMTKNANSHCVKYKHNKKHDGIKVFGKIYLHKEENLE